MLIDLRTYTRHTSGGRLSAAAIIRAARDAGLDGVCITDREHSRDVAEWLALGEEEDFFVGVGVEIETTRGALIVFPREVDALLLNEEWRQLQAVTTPTCQEVVDFARARGAAVVATAIFDGNHTNPMGDTVFRVGGLTAVDAVSSGRRQVENDLTVEAAKALRVPGVGTSGALKSASEIGKTMTLFGDEIRSQAELVNQLEDGDAWAVSLEKRKKEERRRRSKSSKGGRGRGRSSKGGRGRRSRSSKGGGRGRRRSSKGGGRGRRRSSKGGRRD